jgi:hypothetical protein
MGQSTEPGRSRPDTGRTDSQAPVVPPPPRRDATTRRRLRAKLRSRTALRDAFLLHEVLGPPVGLRDGTDRTRAGS